MGLLTHQHLNLHGGEFPTYPTSVPPLVQRGGPFAAVDVPMVMLRERRFLGGTSRFRRRCTRSSSGCTRRMRRARRAEVPRALRPATLTCAAAAAPARGALRRPPSWPQLSPPPSSA